MIRFLGICCFWLLAISDAALASRGCVVPGFRTLENQTVQGTMYAVSGRPCSISMNRYRGPIHSTRLVAPAKHGSVSISGYRVIYVSRPGYAGEDHFVFARHGMDSVNRPAIHTAEVTVIVAAGQR